MTYKSKFLASSVSKMIQRYNLYNSFKVPDMKFHYIPIQGRATGKGCCHMDRNRHTAAQYHTA